MIIIILLIICVILYAAVVPNVRGNIGEAEVRAKLSKLPEEEYFVLNDIMVKTSRGTSQIDHVVVSPYGIFVIETKDYRGWILGGENSEEWTKSEHGRKYHFRNPLKQNYGHVKALEGVLNLPTSYFIPVVAFTSRATIKVKTNQNLIYTEQILDFIQLYQHSRIPPSEAEMIAHRLSVLNITDSDIRREHVNTIHDEIRDVKAKVNSGICPKCGGKLILRDGKYGRFLGCSNYPKCRYTTRY